MNNFITFRCEGIRTSNWHVGSEWMQHNRSHKVFLKKKCAHTTVKDRNKQHKYVDAKSWHEVLFEKSAADKGSGMLLHRFSFAYLRRPRVIPRS